MTIDYTTDVGRVRLLISDLDPAKLVLTDDMIAGYLALEDGNLRRAAAEALDAIASSEVLLSKVITTQDRSTNGAAVAESLRRHAAALRRRADEDDENEAAYFMLIPTRTSRHEGEETKF